MNVKQYCHCFAVPIFDIMNDAKDYDDDDDDDDDSTGGVGWLVSLFYKNR